VSDRGDQECHRSDLTVRRPSDGGGDDDDDDDCDDIHLRHPRTTCCQQTSVSTTVKQQNIASIINRVTDTIDDSKLN